MGAMKITSIAEDLGELRGHGHAAYARLCLLAPTALACAVLPQAACAACAAAACWPVLAR